MDPSFGKADAFSCVFVRWYAISLSHDAGKFGAIISFVDGKMMPLQFEKMLDPKTGRFTVRKVNVDGEAYECACHYMIRLEQSDFDDTCRNSTSSRPSSRWRPGNSVNASATSSASNNIAISQSRQGQQTEDSGHALRRSFGTRWSQRVIPIVLRKLMRHSSIETTLRHYVDQDADELAEGLWKEYDSDAGSGSTGTLIREKNGVK